MPLPATTPQPPYYAVIFTSVRHDGDNGYGAAAKQMFELASTQPGFLGFETARQEIGISVSYWSTPEAITAWKENIAHRQVRAVRRNGTKRFGSASVAWSASMGFSLCPNEGYERDASMAVRLSSSRLTSSSPVEALLIYV